jgi:alginate O-acetyltransferase complex protein AlgI
MLDNFTAVVNSYGYGYQAQPMDILLPMGISFYTFQTMSYTIDMYKRDGEPAKTFLDFALYVTFFPQLVAGPIVRAKDLVSQFYEEKKATANQFIWGLFLLSIGLFQKVVLADTLLSDNSDSVFNSKSPLHFLDAWAGTLAFSGQIFFDFAGYSTCAIGLALMLGFYMTENFKYPYASLGFSDFWTRWHITLSSWLRDYVYIPMGGNRHGILKTYAFLMITMLIGGLWHGAAWTFIVWGGLHGAYLILERLQRQYLPFKITAKNGIFLALTTYGCVNFTWVFFRAKDFHSAWNMIKSMLFLNPDGEKVLGTFDIIKVFILIGIMLLSHWFMRNTSMKEVSEKTSPWILGVVWAVMIFLIAIAQGSGEQFIYFQF